MEVSVEICTATGKPFDAYLKNLKSKPVEKPPFTLQSIFDKVSVKLFAQNRPCVKIDDETGEFILANFNLSGHLSPMLALFDRDRLRIMKKVIGYDELQLLPTDCVYFSSKVGEEYWGDPVKLKYQAATRQVIESFKAVGMTKEQWEFLCLLSDRHLYWMDAVVRGDTIGWRYRPHEEEHEFSYRLHRELSSFANVHKLNTECLKYRTP